jgi:dihydrofolate reductase
MGYTSGMAKLRVASFAVSMDGYSAGPDQSLERPLGNGGEELFAWFFETVTFRAMHGQSGGERGIDDDFAARSMTGMGAWILGRNMFGPVRGPWPDESWRGWWGESPPYHVPTFVLTHHPRAPLVMEGGTTFHFVTGGIHEALDRARAAAGDRDVRIGGGAATIRQFMQERLVDELHLAVRPILFGRGEPLFAGMDWRALGYRVAEVVHGERATHVMIRR